MFTGTDILNLDSREGIGCDWLLFAGTDILSCDLSLFADGAGRRVGGMLILAGRNSSSSAVLFPFLSCSCPGWEWELCNGGLVFTGTDILKLDSRGRIDCDWLLFAGTDILGYGLLRFAGSAGRRAGGMDI